MASNLDVKVFNYTKPLNNICVQNNLINKTKAQPKRHVSEVIIKGTKNPLSKLNIFMMSTIILLLAIQSFIYFYNVQLGINANKLQTEINKTRESSDFLKVELANSKELNKVEKIALNVLSMKAAENGKINYLPLPQVVKDKSLYVTNIAPKDKEVSIPIGY